MIIVGRLDFAWPCDIFGIYRRLRLIKKDPGAQQHPNTVTPSSSSNTPSRRQPSRIPRSPNRSRPTTPSISRPPSS
ncbi:9891_t:CDS:2, partial [Rhizophagus irregularis]